MSVNPGSLEPSQQYITNTLAEPQPPAPKFKLSVDVHDTATRTDDGIKDEMPAKQRRGDQEAKTGGAEWSRATIAIGGRMKQSSHPAPQMCPSGIIVSLCDWSMRGCSRPPSAGCVIGRRVSESV